MSTINFNWDLINPYHQASEERYCPGCGKKARFIDSLKRRVNANGKDLYEFAIFKCEKDHTWNKPLAQYKPGQEKTESPKELILTAPELPLLNIGQCQRQEVRTIVITIGTVIGKWRLDKLLAAQIEDCSRTRITQMIENGDILIDGQRVVPATFLRKGQMITIAADR